MASIKQRKSKGKALVAIKLALDDNLRPVPGAQWSEANDTAYALRKQQFADLPPAKIVRPLRAVRKMYEQALAAWHRAYEQHGETVFPYAAELLYRSAHRAAKYGDGAKVRQAAASVA